MATLKTALDSARTWLHDDSANRWSDTVLIPAAQEAFRELLIELELNGIPVVKKTSTFQTVVAGTTVLATITDLVEPIELYERRVGGPTSDYTHMTEVTVLPNFDQANELLYWSWRGEQIQLLGALTNREVKVDYIKSLPIPTLLTDSLGFIGAELYIGPRVAAIKYALGQKDIAVELLAQARSNLDKIVRFNVKGQQGTPLIRRPFRRSGVRRIIR